MQPWSGQYRAHFPLLPAEAEALVSFMRTMTARDVDQTDPTDAEVLGPLVESGNLDPDIFAHCVLAYPSFLEHRARKRRQELDRQSTHKIFAYLILLMVCEKFNRETETEGVVIQLRAVA